MLTAPFPGITVAQWFSEFLGLIAEYRTLKPRRVAELGTWHGGTLWHLLNNAMDGADVISVDMGPTNWRPAKPDFDVSQWYAWAPGKVKLHIIQEDTHDPATLAKVEAICPELDFLFIDGDHSYEGAKRDFEMYGPLVREGGIIAFHDLITPRAQQHIQISKLWAEIKRAGYKTLELYSHPGQEWGGIGLVYV